MKQSLSGVGFGLALGLALSLLSTSALARPIHEAKAQAEAHKQGSARADHLDLAFGSHDSRPAKKHSHAQKEPKNKEPKKHVDVEEETAGLRGRIIVPSAASSATPAVPEPSALLLFGVGCLITRGVLSRNRA